MDKNVKEFLNDLESFMPDKAKIIKAIRKMVLKVIPEAIEVMMYGGIVYKTDILLCGIFPRKKHISIEFGNGNKLDDPYSVLEGKGKERRHIKIIDYEEIEKKKVKYYVESACRFK